MPSGYSKFFYNQQSLRFFKELEKDLNEKEITITCSRNDNDIHIWDFDGEKYEISREELYWRIYEKRCPLVECWKNNRVIVSLKIIEELSGGRPYLQITLDGLCEGDENKFFDILKRKLGSLENGGGFVFDRWGIVEDIDFSRLFEEKSQGIIEFWNKENNHFGRVCEEVNFMKINRIGSTEFRDYAYIVMKKGEENLMYMFQMKNC